MANFELLDANGDAVNTIVADISFVEANYPGLFRELADSGPAPAIQTLITRLAFLSRFTDAEAIALDLASIGATVQAATLRRYMSKVNAAAFIDLGREDTRAGVLALESMGILAAGRALEILDTPVLPQEVPR